MMPNESQELQEKLIDLVSWPAAGRSEGHGSLSLISANAYLKSVS